MRKAKVLYKDQEAGILSQLDDGSFTYDYHGEWLANPLKPSISLTLPKREGSFRSATLFSFFYNMLPEGTNKKVVCKYNRLDEKDYFSLLMITAGNDSIGAVRVEKMGRDE